MCIMSVVRSPLTVVFIWAFRYASGFPLYLCSAKDAAAIPNALEAAEPRLLAFELFTTSPERAKQIQHKAPPYEFGTDNKNPECFFEPKKTFGIIFPLCYSGRCPPLYLFRPFRAQNPKLLFLFQNLNNTFLY